MTTSATDPAKQPVQWKEALPTLGAGFLMLAGFVIAQLYSKWLGLLVAAPVLVFMVVAFRRMSRDEKARVAAALKAQEETPLGRVMRVMELVTLLVIAAAAALWLYSRF